jgi:hypothetical protein
MSEKTEMSIEELQTAMLRTVRAMSPAEKAELRAAIRRTLVEPGERLLAAKRAIVMKRRPDGGYIN